MGHGLTITDGKNPNKLTTQAFNKCVTILVCTINHQNITKDAIARIHKILQTGKNSIRDVPQQSKCQTIKVLYFNLHI